MTKPQARRTDAMGPAGRKMRSTLPVPCPWSQKDHMSVHIWKKRYIHILIKTPFRSERSQPNHGSAQAVPLEYAWTIGSCVVSLVAEQQYGLVIARGRRVILSARFCYHSKQSTTAHDCYETAVPNWLMPSDVPMWCPRGTHLVHLWCPFGTPVVPIWYTRGTHLVHQCFSNISLCIEMEVYI